MPDIEDLKSALRRGQAVLVVGTGATISATNGAVTSTWVGLVRDGLAFIEKRDSESGNWLGVQRSLLDFAVESGGADELLQVASAVSQRIRKYGPQAYSDWLEAAIGSLEAVDDSWQQALLGLGAPILTTNFDRLLEKAGGRESVDWKDAKGLQQVLAGSGAIGHLHGVYTKPETVVLSEADYARQQEARPVQALQQAASATTAIIYVGCGGTLEDPNFSSLLDWHAELFEVSGVKHFRLCRTSELASLLETHRNDNITPIDFGDDYTEMPAFLASLMPPAEVSRRENGVVRDIMRDAREVIMETLREETIIGESLIDLDDKTIDELLIAPVLLPLPHAEYLRRNAEDDTAVERVDPLEESDADGVILLVGDENSGLTTAIKWILYQASMARGYELPLYVDFRAVPAGFNPLETTTRKELLRRAVIAGKRDPMPEVILGIDNFHANGVRASRVVDEISSRKGLTILGCQSSFEPSVVELLTAAEITPRVRYIGKLETKDVLAMAKLATSSSANKLLGSIVTTLAAEHLPRNPFTIALLISILLRGETLALNSSPTTILDQYVNHLLGGDDPNQDPRYALTSTDKESIVADLAALFVERDHGSMPESDVVERMEKFFARFGWTETPSVVLRDLIRRRVLAEDANQVRFTQASFLHLFAAKAAAKRRELVDTFLERPIYYAPILRAYAALVRHDARLLEALAPMADERWDLDMDQSVFRRGQQRTAPDNLEELLSSDENASRDGTDNEEDQAASNKQLDLLDVVDSELLPFPLTSDAEMARELRFAQGLELVSVVLRDSEEIPDLDLKTRTLAAALRGWSHLIDVFVTDDAFKDMMRNVATQARDAINESLTQEQLEEFVRLMPPMVAMAALGNALASRKLLAILTRVLEEDGASNDATLVVPAAMLLSVIQDPNWDAKVGPLLRHLMNDVEVVRDFFSFIITVDFHFAARGSTQEQRLCELAADLYVSKFTFPSPSRRSATKSAYIQRIRRMKLEATRDANNGASREISA